MPVITFISSLFVCGLVLSTVDNTPVSTDASSELDYHYVPYAGDVFGA